MTTIQTARVAIKDATDLPINNLGELEALLRSAPGIPTRSQHDMLAALNTLAKAAGKPLAAMPAQPEALRRILNTLTAAMAGVSEGRWRNVRSLLRRALNVGHSSRSAGVFRNPRSPAWVACLARLPRAAARYRLSRLSGFCSREGIEPEKVSDASFDAFLATLQADPVVPNPHRIHRSAILAWNTQASIDPDWPAPALHLPSRRKFYKVAVSDLPASLETDIQMWLRRLAGTDLCDEHDFAPLRPRSIRTRTEQIRNFTSAMVRAGVDPASLRGLADVVIPAHVAKALEFVRERVGGSWTGHTQNLANLACSIARHYVEAGPEQLERLAKMRRKASPQQKGMTEGNRARLRAFDDPQKLEDLLRLPPRLLNEVLRGGPPSVELARLLRGAVALEILIMAPIRLHNLLSLRLGEDLLAGPRGTMTLALAPKQTKNREPFEAMLPPPTARMLALYLERYQPLLTRRPCPWLFPNKAGDGSIAAENLRLQIKKLARERVGVILHPHLFRHIAVKVILNGEPGAYGRARLTLGHKSVKTTETFYASTENRAAVELYGADVLRIRGSRDLNSGRVAKRGTAPSRKTRR